MIILTMSTVRFPCVNFLATVDQGCGNMKLRKPRTLLPLKLVLKNVFDITIIRHVLEHTKRF